MIIYRCKVNNTTEHHIKERKIIMFNNADLILEIADLLSYNKYTHDIEVDKDIFDEFEEGKLIYIHFVEDEEDVIREYEMVSENRFGIVMEYMCEYSG